MRTPVRACFSVWNFVMRCIAFIVLFFSLALFAGCGQKGPLYLPGDPSQVKTDLPTQQSGQEDGDEEEDEKDDEGPQQ